MKRKNVLARFAYAANSSLQRLTPEVIGINCVRHDICDTSHGIPALRVMVFHHPVKLTINDQDFSVEEESLVIIPKDIPAIYGNGSEKWSHSWLRVSGPATDYFSQKYFLPELTPIKLKDSTPFLNWLWLLHSEMQNVDGTESRIIENLFDIIGGRVDAASPNVWAGWNPTVSP